MFSLVYAVPIQEERIFVEVLNETHTYYNISVFYKEITSDKITYAFIGTIDYLISSKVDGSDVNCTLRSFDIGSEIICPKGKEVNSTLTLEFLTQNAVRDRGTIYEFFFEKAVVDTTDRLFVEVVLPPKAVIAENVIGNSINPPNFKLSIDESGRRIIVSWNIDAPLLGNKYDFSILFELPISKEVPNKQEQTYAIIIAVVLAIIIAVASYVFYMRYRTSHVVEVLKEDEKVVLNAIKELGNGCKHKDIVKITGFSKAKVSRILQELNKRNIIRLERVGKNTKIYIN